MAEGDSICRLVRSQADAAQALSWVGHILHKTLPGGPVRIEMGRELRSPEQNDKMWPMLRDLSEQVEWYGQKLSETDWKHLISALVKKQRIVPGIDGGFVALGQPTKNMSKKLFSEMIESIYAFGAERNVAWSEKAMQVYQEWQAEQRGAA